MPEKDLSIVFSVLEKKRGNDRLHRGHFPQLSRIFKSLWVEVFLQHISPALASKTVRLQVSIVDPPQKEKQSIWLSAKENDNQKSLTFLMSSQKSTCQFSVRHKYERCRTRGSNRPQFTIVFKVGFSEDSMKVVHSIQTSVFNASSHVRKVPCQGSPKSLALDIPGLFLATSKEDPNLLRVSECDVNTLGPVDLDLPSPSVEENDDEVEEEEKNDTPDMGEGSSICLSNSSSSSSCGSPSSVVYENQTVPQSLCFSPDPAQFFNFVPDTVGSLSSFSQYSTDFAFPLLPTGFSQPAVYDTLEYSQTAVLDTNSVVFQQSIADQVLLLMGDKLF